MNRMIAGFILTGGKNRRMAGEKKLFLDYQGQPFWVHLLTALEEFPTVYLSVDREEPYASAGLPMVRDLWPDMGPMGGIASGLRQCPEDTLFVTACDTPLLDRATVELILANWDGGVTLASTQGRIQPLIGIYPKSVLPELEKRLAKGELRMYDFLRAVGFRQVPLPEGSAAAENINTPEEYRQLTENRESSKTPSETT
jgi:molybdopterin-guanine dinucleotide biosynthesis protein A